MNLKKCLILLLFCFLSYSASKRKQAILTEGQDSTSYKRFKVQCTKDSKVRYYEIGDTPCRRLTRKVSRNEKLKITYKTLNAKSEDPYERGYQELHRYKNGKLVEKMRLRDEGEAHWLETPFVRVRKQKYLADLDGDGIMEFAIHRFHPGSAIWNTVKIYSLKKKITFWGKGRYQFEGDTFVKLGCPKCSKFNPEACKGCK